LPVRRVVSHRLQSADCGRSQCRVGTEMLDAQWTLVAAQDRRVEGETVIRT